jgi:hypothetical protein
MENMNLNTGDLIVGTNDPTKSVYSPEGKRLLAGGVALVGTEEDISRIQHKINTAGERTGPPMVEGKKGKKKINKPLHSYKTTSPEILNNFSTEPLEVLPPQIDNVYVYFENSFGRIRCGVERVQEHDQAFMLVFACENDIVFEPKVGETLELTYNRVKYSVYYPGVIFDWTDGVKKVMILFKTPTDNE